MNRKRPDPASTLEEETMAKPAPPTPNPRKEKITSLFCRIKRNSHPFWLVPACLLIAILIFELIILLGETPKSAAFIALTGVAITAWIHFLLCRRIWERIFHPSRLVPACLLTMIAILELIVLRGEDPRITGFITVTGVAITAWVHFLHRREIWARALNQDVRTAVPGASLGKESGIDYLLDYLHIARAIRDRQIDRIIEARLASDERRREKEKVGSLNTVFLIRRIQLETKATHFVMAVYEKEALEALESAEKAGQKQTAREAGKREKRGITRKD